MSWLDNHIDILESFIILIISIIIFLIYLRYKTIIKSISIICGIDGFIFVICKYVASQIRAKINYTMHVVSRMQGDILNQDTINDKLAGSRKSIIKEVKSKAIINYISEYYGDRPISKSLVNNIRAQIRRNFVFSELNLQKNAKLRVIGYSIVKLNRWATYINSKGMDFNKSLLFKQLRGMIPRFLSRNDDVFSIMKQNNVPLGALRKLNSKLKHKSIFKRILMKI